MRGLSPTRGSLPPDSSGPAGTRFAVLCSAVMLLRRHAGVFVAAALALTTMSVSEPAQAQGKSAQKKGAAAKGKKSDGKQDDAKKSDAKASKAGTGKGEKDTGAEAKKDGEVVEKVDAKEGKDGVKTYTFKAIDVEGRLKSPQLLYFLRRVRAEFRAGDLGHRSFLRELADTRRHPALR